MSNTAKDYLANEGYEPLFGARPLKRVIRQLVEIPLSMKILEGEFKKGDKIKADVENNQLVFNKI